MMSGMGGEVPEQAPPRGSVASGELRLNPRVTSGIALVTAVFWAGLCGSAADWFVILNDPNYLEPVGVSVPKRVAATAAATLIVGIGRLWWTWRSVGTALVWNEGGLAYRASPKECDAIPWHHIYEIKPKEKSSDVRITGVPPDHDFILEFSAAKNREGNRWRVWTHSQRELIDALQTARAAVATSTSGPPPIPAQQHLPWTMVAVCVLAAAAMTALLVGFDQSHWLMTLSGLG